MADADRGIEHYAFLQSLMNGERIYPRLVKHFRDADDRYNSGLFHFRAGRRDMPGGAGHDRNPPGISDRVPSPTQTHSPLLDSDSGRGNILPCSTQGAPGIAE